MTGREKIEAALSKDGTPEIAAVICYEGIYIRDHWDQLTDRPWWYQHSPDMDHQLAWRSDMIARTGQDWFALPSFYSSGYRKHLSIQERPEGVFFVDKRTGREDILTRPQVAGWSVSGGLHSVKPRRLAETTDEIDLLISIPNGDPRNAESHGADDLAISLLEGSGAELYPICHVGSPLWATYSLWGFEGMMTLIATRPDLVKHACRRYLARCIYSIRAAAALGAAGIWIEECMTDMISPEAFVSLCLPYVRSLVDEIRSAGLTSIYYFCGDPAGKWDLLLSAGADAISLEESKKAFVIDIEDVVEIVKSRCAVLGNLDAINLLPNASEEQLRAEIYRQMAAGRRNGSRFIMSLGSPVTPGTPVKRVRLYCDLVHELGRAL
jgi:uroporphyrinogen-III decarboxylase